MTTSSLLPTQLPSPGTPEYKLLAPKKQVLACETWLRDNPDDPLLKPFVESMLEDAEEKARLTEEKARLTEEKARLTEEKARLVEAADKTSLKAVCTEYVKITDRTMSGFYWPENHGHASVVSNEIESDMFDGIRKLFMSEDFWKITYIGSSKGGNCDSETEVVVQVKLLLEAVIKGLKLNEVVEVSLGRTLAGVECGILLIYTPNRLPFATLEIKKPPTDKDGLERLFYGDSKKGGNLVTGEVAAEMNAVKLFGFRKVYGMIATWNHWRLLCTGSMNEDSDDLDAMKRSLEELQKMAIAPNVVDEAAAAGQRVEESPPQNQVRYDGNRNWSAEKLKVHASQVIPSFEKKVEGAGLEVVQLVTLFVLKACTSLMQLLESKDYHKDAIKIGPQMACRIISFDSKELFSFGTVSCTTVALDNFKKWLSTIYVTHHLGMGDSGDCWLGISESGASACAVKFFINVRQAQTEFDNWNKTYGTGKCRHPPTCRLVTLLAGAKCLVMPYLRPIPKEERHKMLKKKTIKKVLEDFAKSGYIHCDIKWRHFGRWKNDIFLLDLGYIAKADDATVTSWIADSLKKLHDTAGKPPEASSMKTPPSKRSTSQTGTSGSSRKKKKVASLGQVQQQPT